MTLAGTETALLALDSATSAPPGGATAVRVTEPVDGLPPPTGFGLALMAASAAAPAAGCHPSCTTSKSLALSSENAGFKMLLS